MENTTSLTEELAREIKEFEDKLKEKGLFLSFKNIDTREKTIASIVHEFAFKLIESKLLYEDD